MPSIPHALSDLLTSLLEVISSFFTTAASLIQSTLHFFLRFVTGIFNVFVDFVRGLVDLAGGLVSFLVGNVIMLGVVAALVFGFLQYQRSQGRQVTVGGKKVN
ncbi:hypothetical protein GMOD_00001558 [Pyrenophora seminiperda CCB06]|uniref:Uncharacterized protein n=1 Tax=Pyrenophora seminiperda CCB06 TaxID=1302712 RepID=A0A3M7LZH4_9PLEO|nr:hypothetical protein GMOD_00001558 [Pyrenophora seminiperda CCB06]